MPRCWSFASFTKFSKTTRRFGSAFLRAIDESGEDYLFPQEFFVPIQLPESAVALFSHAA